LFTWDYNYMLLVFLPTLLITLLAQWRVKSAFRKWDSIPNGRGLSGQDTARMLMSARGLGNVGVESTPGHLTDHYDPRTKTIHLSASSTARPSVAAMAIVAHELGHAEQDMTGNAMLRLRAALVPAASIGSNLGMWLVIGGLILGQTGLAWLGIILFALAVVFTFVTLPVEFDASRRAKKNLRELNLTVSDQDEEGVDAVLNAAALTYVAAAATAALQLAYWISRVSGGRRN
jgi:Zn-dependent membrane protease YugP